MDKTGGISFSNVRVFTLYCAAIPNLKPRLPLSADTKHFFWHGVLLTVCLWKPSTHFSPTRLSRWRARSVMPSRGHSHAHRTIRNNTFPCLWMKRAAVWTPFIIPGFRGLTFSSQRSTMRRSRLKIGPNCECLIRFEFDKLNVWTSGFTTWFFNKNVLTWDKRHISLWRHSNAREVLFHLWALLTERWRIMSVLSL